MAIDPEAGVEPVLERCEVSAARSGAGELVLHLAGAWTLHNRIPALDALHYESSDPMADNPPEGLTPGWDRHPRVDWSRRAGKSWELDPVLLHRRQAGQPERPGDDLSNKTLGIELRRRF